ncbi:MAG: 5-methylphenazine-carboxylate 1-monooxygenase [Ilumatobacteraceae bacterium]|nr:5-methylphenazine-carboxylate 1-monooxygenase [Ilumatobacteraceae bacterium]
MDDILIAGGGIGGLTAALSLHRAGFQVRVFESVDRIQALGVGINLLPHAVRELDALGLADELTANGITPATLAYFTKRGERIWDEPRGLAAGYRWPQISIHRGLLHTILHAAAAASIGADRIHTGCHLDRFVETADGVEATFVERRTGTETATARGSIMVACDGIHSVVRRHFYPDEGMPKWNGSLLWRGLADGPPVFDGRTMVWAGHPRQKFVLYPVLDLPGGRQQLNFIAELRTDSTELVEREDWNKPGDLADFLPQFEEWSFPWLDVPALISSAPGTFLFPMVDRDPVDRWSFGRVTLLGDAAHPMYPIGSNGASQAILDARTLTGCLLSYRDDVEHALRRYDEVRRPATSAIVLANRGLGPELPMQLVEERAPAGFERLGDVITAEEILEVTDGYRKMAGFSLQQLHDRPSLADVRY